MRPFDIVVAMDEDRGIGRDGGLPWALAEDLKLFRTLTAAVQPGEGLNVVIMGRRTWESLPRRPLPGRHNIVVTSTLTTAGLQSGLADGAGAGAVRAARTLEAALEECTAATLDPPVCDVFVVGGGQLYAHALGPLRRLCHDIHVSEVPGRHGCDTFFPAFADGCRRAEQHPPRGGFQYSRWTSANPEEEAYLGLVRSVAGGGGEPRPDRTGVGTLSTFGARLRFDLRLGVFPLLTTKKMFWRGVAEELLWMLRGDTDAARLAAKGVHIWDANGSRAELDARGLGHRREGDLGPVYGFQWRHFGAPYSSCDADYSGQGVDQLARLVEGVRADPHSRRHLLYAWNPAALHEMALPPCHVLAQFYVAGGELSCQLYQRSGDLGLGVPFNIASYALLTRIVAEAAGLRPGELILVLGDAHVYLSHAEALSEQARRTPRPFPALTIGRPGGLDPSAPDFGLEAADFRLHRYRPMGAVKMPMAT